jgi:hypothetical protein
MRRNSGRVVIHNTLIFNINNKFGWGNFIELNNYNFPIFLYMYLLFRDVSVVKHNMVIYGIYYCVNIEYFVEKGKVNRVVKCLPWQTHAHAYDLEYYYNVQCKTDFELKIHLSYIFIYLYKLFIFILFYNFCFISLFNWNLVVDLYSTFSFNMNFNDKFLIKLYYWTIILIKTLL